jgi:hypothetical protein
VRDLRIPEAIPEEASPFLYTNSARQLHYQLAFFRIAVRKMEQDCEKQAPDEMNRRSAAQLESEIQI